MKGIVSSALLLAAGLNGAAAAQQPQVTVDVSAGGSVSTNPVLYVDSETAGAVNLGVRPVILWEDEVVRTIIDGDLRLAQYTKRYGSDFSGRIGVASDRKIDERTTLRIASTYQSSRSAVQAGFFFSLEAPLGSAPERERGCPFVSPPGVA